MTRLADVVAELNSPDPQRRRETVRALARLRAFAAIDVLRQVAESDPDEEARVLAVAAVAFLERAQVEAQQRPPRRSATAAPDLSEGALRSKEAIVSARHLSTGEFVLVGALVTLVAALFLLLLGGGFNALRARLEATPLPQTRDSVVAEMREIIRVSRETAEQLRAVPALVVGSAGGLDCADLPSIPATYRLPDSERTAYPELGPAEGALHEARIALHDVEARWRRECQDGRLREAQAHILTQTEAFIQAGLAALAEAERVLDLLPPLPTVTPTGVSWYTNRDG